MIASTKSPEDIHDCLVFPEATAKRGYGLESDGDEKGWCLSTRGQKVVKGGPYVRERA